MKLYVVMCAITRYCYFVRVGFDRFTWFKKDDVEYRDDGQGGVLYVNEKLAKEKGLV